VLNLSADRLEVELALHRKPAIMLMLKQEGKMTTGEAIAVIEKWRIRDPRKLRAAAQVLTRHDAVTYKWCIERLLDRANKAEALRSTSSKKGA
jgi:hypothetical protein